MSPKEERWATRELARGLPGKEEWEVRALKDFQASSVLPARMDLWRADSRAVFSSWVKGGGGGGGGGDEWESLRRENREGWRKE